MQVVEVAGGKLRHKLRELRPDVRRKVLVLRQDEPDVAGRVPQLLRRICEQRRQRLERPVHHATSIGFLARFGVPNRLVSVVPPEQPFPKEKPQEPRRSYASSLISRCAVGITKRSS